MILEVNIMGKQHILQVIQFNIFTKSSSSTQLTAVLLNQHVNVLLHVQIHTSPCAHAIFNSLICQRYHLNNTHNTIIETFSINVYTQQKLHNTDTQYIHNSKPTTCNHFMILPDTTVYSSTSSAKQYRPAAVGN